MQTVFLEVGLESYTDSAAAPPPPTDSVTDNGERNEVEQLAGEAAERIEQLRKELEGQRQMRQVLEKRVRALTADAEACELDARVAGET